MEPLSFMISTCAKNPRKQPTQNKQQSLPNLLYGYKTKHRTKGIYLYKHGLNIGRDVGCLNSSPSTVNKRKSVLQALLTRIRFNKGMCDL